MLYIPFEMLLCEFLEVFFVEGLVDLNVQIGPSLTPYRYLKFIHGLHKVGPSYVYFATSFYKRLKWHHIINVLDSMGPKKVGNVDKNTRRKILGLKYLWHWM